MKAAVCIPRDSSALCIGPFVILIVYCGERLQSPRTPASVLCRWIRSSSQSNTRWCWMMCKTETDQMEHAACLPMPARRATFFSLPPLLRWPTTLIRLGPKNDHIGAVRCTEKSLTRGSFIMPNDLVYLDYHKIYRPPFMAAKSIERASVLWTRLHRVNPAEDTAHRIDLRQPGTVDHCLEGKCISTTNRCNERVLAWKHAKKHKSKETQDIYTRRQHAGGGGWQSARGTYTSHAATLAIVARHDIDGGGGGGAN